MARILGIDYGKKRTGIAATDPLQLIVSPIGTHDTKALIDFLKEYIGKEEVEKIVIGMPVHADGNYTYLKKDIDIFAAKIRSLFPDIRIDYVDESHTSIQAKEIIRNINHQTTNLPFQHICRRFRPGYCKRPPAC